LLIASIETFPTFARHIIGMNEALPPNPERRGFFKKSAAAIISVLLGMVPLGAGIAVYLDPLRKKSSQKSAIKVATLDALPDDGIPRKFPVVSARKDAWNKFSEVPIGAVYLRRTPEGKLQAFNVVCPHAGCFVDFLPDRGMYLCPCHNSTFAINGEIGDRASPAARGLDSLDVEVRGKEIWVRFQNFQAGRAEKIPTA
jgi:Rieske Fe-S protein